MNSPKTSVEPSCVLTRLGFWKQTGHSVCVMCFACVKQTHACTCPVIDNI